VINTCCRMGRGPRVTAGLKGSHLRILITCTMRILKYAMGNNVKMASVYFLGKRGKGLF
jgi:hypothetical protein